MAVGIAVTLCAATASAGLKEDFQAALDAKCGGGINGATLMIAIMKAQSAGDPCSNDQVKSEAAACKKASCAELVKTLNDKKAGAGSTFGK